MAVLIDIYSLCFARRGRCCAQSFLALIVVCFRSDATEIFRESFGKSLLEAQEVRTTREQGNDCLFPIIYIKERNGGTSKTPIDKLAPFRSEAKRRHLSLPSSPSGQQADRRSRANSTTYRSQVYSSIAQRRLIQSSRRRQRRRESRIPSSRCSRRRRGGSGRWRGRTQGRGTEGFQNGEASCE